MKTSWRDVTLYDAAGGGLIKDPARRRALLMEYRAQGAVGAFLVDPADYPDPDDEAIVHAGPAPDAIDWTDFDDAEYR